MRRHYALALGLLAAFAGCDNWLEFGSVTDGSAPVDEPVDALAGPRIDDPTVCWAAGGQCVSVDVFGNPECALLGPDNACYPEQNGGGSFCCAYDAGICPWRTVEASDYNQACKVDADCVPIAEGDPCTLCGLRCVNAAINIGDLPDYSDAISRTAAYLSSQSPACDLDCPYASLYFGSCCIAGTCQFGSQCENPVQPTDGGAETGAGSDARDAGAVADAVPDAGANASASDAADASAE
jgi:hypothetical protein